MAKKLSEQELLSKEDFSRAKKMTKKDRNLCKAQFDILYNRLKAKDERIAKLEGIEKIVAKKDKDILEMGKLIDSMKAEEKKMCKQFKAEIDKRDGDVKTWMKRYNEMESLYNKAENSQTRSIGCAIIFGIVAICLGVLLFANGVA